MFADSKNVSYSDFCEKYNQYSIEWLSVRAHAVTPLDQIQAALDFQTFENHLMVEGIYSAATFAHNQFLLDGNRDRANDVAHKIFFKSGLFQAKCINARKLRLLRYLPPRTRPVLFLTTYHDILMRTRILASTDRRPSYLALCRRYEACSVLSHTIKNQILDEPLLMFKDAQDDFEWFIENQYPIWDVITEKKEWTKEKVRIMRGIIRTAKDSIQNACKSML